MSYFMETTPNIEGNNRLREPQIEAYLKIKEYFKENPKGEALVVLPTGTGKSGLISIAPYGVSEKRVLIITPGLITKDSVIKTLHPLESNFWINYDVLFDPEDLPVVEEYDKDMLDTSLENCNFVVANVHKLYKDNPNSLLNRVERNFFDMIIVDEAHHSIAQTWVDALEYFNDAKVLHLTGTPYRGDGIELPGEKIHETKLSEVMALKYVKLLRKFTVENSEMYFTLPDDSNKYTKDEILEIKDENWVEKSVALSKECSNEVIEKSIEKLDELVELSPDVPHKILAVATSIAHANDLKKWYEEKGKKVTLIHSGLSKDALNDNLLEIEANNTEVVVSVDMLKEGYDHKYLTVLALFRPYRSKNAFAQIIGRVLRAIPDGEITDFNIDNNAFVIYHKETGLDVMWQEFQKEVDDSKKKTVTEKEYVFEDREYIHRKIIYGDIEVGEGFLGEAESYIPNLDFNKMFEDARISIELDIKGKVEALDKGNLSPDEIEAITETLRAMQYRGKKSELDELLISKRPELARQKIRDSLVKDANEAASMILEKKGIEPKGNSLYPKFRGLIYKLDPNTTNDGILVRYINTRVNKIYGSAKSREPQVLLESQKYMAEIVKELEKMI